MEILGSLVGLVGVILFFGCCIWFLVVAFKQETAWGIACLIPVIGIFASLAFLVNYWNKASKPFAIQVIGFVAIAIGNVIRDGTL
jgi:hypothetical protein